MSTKLYPSAPLEPLTAIEERSENEIIDVISFKKSVNNVKEIIAYFKYENRKSQKKFEKYIRKTTILKSFDLFVIIATTSTVTLSVTGIGVIVITISTGVACVLTISNEIVYEIVMLKYGKNKKHYEKKNNEVV